MLYGWFLIITALVRQQENEYFLDKLLGTGIANNAQDIISIARIDYSDKSLTAIITFNEFMIIYEYDFFNFPQIFFYYYH
ncbi:hypothetical protein PBNK5_27630 [Pectobacterium brasiliense]